MNKVTRMLAMAGISLAATAMIGAGSASAASAATASVDKAPSTAAKAGFPGRTKVVGYYRNAFTCHRVGNAGEWRHRWDDHDCSRVPPHFHRGMWVLVVKWNRHFGGPGNFGGHDDYDGPGNFGGNNDYHGPG